MQPYRNIGDEIAHLLDRALAESGFTDHPAIVLGRPADPSHGDYSSNIAFPLAKAAGKKPRDIAADLASRISGPVESSAAGGGFLNFRITPDALRVQLASMADPAWGTDAIGGGRTINVEYVSANPTGPLHVGHGRGAILGDAIARLLLNAGFSVTREYYLNNIGRQIELLGESVLHAARSLAGSDDGGWEKIYGGDVVEAVSRRYLEEKRPLPSKSEDSAAARAAAGFASELIFDRILEDLRRLKITFDSVVRESSLEPAIPELVSDLRKKDLVYDAAQAEGTEGDVRREGSKAAQHREEMQGGTFLRTSRFGDETDRIILRANGAPTYFTSDIAYHRGKYGRGFERLINIWGADHGGHVKRMKAAMASLDLPAEKLDVVLCQMVRLIRDGREVKMSKRTGQTISLAELTEEVGPDAVRFFFLSRSPSSQLDFDLDLAVKQSADNPVFYCQYAHARTRQLLAKGAEEGLAPSAQHLDRLTHESEIEIMRRIATIPETLRSAALKLEPHRLPETAMELAQALHRYQTKGKSEDALRIVRPSDPATSSARLFLVERVGRAMKELFSLMGIEAPERM